MSVSTILKRNTDQRLADQGFERSTQKMSGVWLYERQRGNTVYTIMFQTSQLSRSITLRFHTNFHPGVNLKQLFHANEFPPYLSGLLKQSQLDFIEYSSESELEEIIRALTDVAIEKILPLFDVIVRPPKRPSEEMYQLLTEHVQSYADEFIGKHHMSYVTETLRIQEQIQNIEHRIDQNRSATQSDREHFFLTAAAYLGELILRRHAGIWEGDRSYYYVLLFNDNVTKQGDMHTIKWSPLDKIFRYWDKPEFYKQSIRSSYQGLLRLLGEDLS